MTTVGTPLLWGGFGALVHPTLLSLAAIALLLGGAVIASVGSRLARKAVILVAGSAVTAVGLAMIVLPGPAIVVIPLGLAILATEFPWARRLLDRIRGLFARLRRRRAADQGSAMPARGGSERGGA